MIEGRLFAAMLMPAAATAGCGPAIHPSFDSPEPAARNAAIVRATAASDAASVPDLVRMLRSDDPATRLLAITSLRRMTGETFGYDYGAPPGERDAAIARWERHIAERSSAAPAAGMGAGA
ncbi:MAG: hypothetical protein JNK25_11000 [Phycisphaerae bacterium]|nr:hypothetical protein [Phycisphaerae bacterium]